MQINTQYVKQGGDHHSCFIVCSVLYYERTGLIATTIFSNRISANLPLTSTHPTVEKF